VIHLDAREPASGPCPAAGNVSLWWVDLDAEDGSGAGHGLSTLSHAERIRASMMVRPTDRARFIAAWASLRQVLATELGTDPRSVPVYVAPGGKPLVPGTGLHFSTSRRAGVAVHATSWTCQVGVDVESVAEALNMDRVAGRYFSAAEQRTVEQASPDRRQEARLRCWTAKEAYLKGTGTGLVDDLAAVDLASAITGTAVLDGWHVHGVAAPPGAVASLAWKPVTYADGPATDSVEMSGSGTGRRQVCRLRGGQP
jgi:4'-phosphopantetheinyl transferase